MSDPIATITQNQAPILLAEIAALVHDLGKLSGEFVADKAEKSDQLSFAHHLVLRRTSSGVSAPPAVSSQDIAQFTQAVQQAVATWQQSLPSGVADEQTRSRVKRDLVKQLRRAHNISDSLAPILFEEALIPPDFLPQSLVNVLNTIRASLGSQLGDITLGDPLEQHHTPFYLANLNRFNSGAPQVVEVVKSCDRADSGVDKAIPQAKQAREQTYFATVFGYEQPGCPIILTGLTGVRDTVCQQLAQAFQAYLQGQMDVVKLREEVLHVLVPSDGQSGFYVTLGDTRRAANDVTLADHSYSVASIFKAAVAEALIKGQPPGDQIRWKLLGVKWDGLRIISKAFRVNDVLGRWEMIRRVKEALRRFVELEFPIGNKVYDDEDGIYFTVPNLGYEGTHVIVANYLRDRVLEIVNRESDGEIVPSLLLLKQETRSLVQLTWLIKGEDQQRVVNLLKNQSFEPQWVVRWDQVNRGRVDLCPLCGRQHQDVPGMENRPLDICPVCRVRPKREGLEACPFCQHWREEGSRVREREGIHWLDLIADDNNQVALITGRFCLESWLHGEQTDTMFSQSLADWGQGQYPDLTSRLEQALNGVDLRILGEVGGEAWEGFLRAEGLWKEWQDYLQGKRTNVKGSCTEDAELVTKFYKAVVLERDVRELSGQATSPEERAPWLAHFLFRKHPSPARLRRVWRTTQRFSLQIRYDLEEALELRTTWRFQLDGEFERGKIYEDVAIDKMPVELYFDGRYFHVIQQLKEEPRVGAKVHVGGTTYTLTSQPEKRDYRPYASILISPITFQFLVPADKALDITNAVRARYQKEMGKVRNRLPLDLGIVYFMRKTPLYVAVDAARRMMEMGRGNLHPEEWTVLTQPQVDKTNHQVHLVLQTANGQRVEWQVSYQLGDPAREDFYHPYFVVSDCDPAMPPGLRKSYFQVPELGHLVHVTELQEHDRIRSVPGYFDFEFLDSSTRRYDVRYTAQAGKRRHPVVGEAGPRPYYLDELDIFARLWWMLSGRGNFRLADGSTWQGLTITQIKGLEAVLAERFARWNPESMPPEFVAAALANTFGLAWTRFNDADREAMRMACLSGQLFDVTELYIRLCGQKLTRTREEESE